MTKLQRKCKKKQDWRENIGEVKGGKMAVPFKGERVKGKRGKGGKMAAPLKGV